MPPDIIQTQKEVARKMLLGENTVPDDAWHTSIYDKKAADLDIVVATIIANIGRELEARCEGEEKIICSAVRFKDKIWMGHRHMHAMEAMHGELSYTMNRKEMNEQQTDRDQGFVTSKGRYVGREEAWDIAEKAGQLNERKNKTPGYLYSEDVW